MVNVQTWERTTGYVFYKIFNIFRLIIIQAQESQGSLEKNTIPKPEVISQDRSALNEHNLGVPQTATPPDLSASPFPQENNSTLQASGKSAQVVHSGCKECCMKNVKSHSEELCPVSPYNLEQCKDKKLAADQQLSESQGKPLKGILKKTDMAATAGRTPPDQPDPNSQPPVPNELRPVLKGGGPCYLPQLEDYMPDEKGEKEMGPIGPWATGRVDWGPLSGMTGTRPVVDKYSITRYSDGEWRKHNADMLNMATEAQHKANL